MFVTRRIAYGKTSGFAARLIEIFDMFRKALTTLSLIGLLISLALWGASYFSISYERTLDGRWTRLHLRGAKLFCMRADISDPNSTDGRWSIEGFSPKSGIPVPWMTFGPLGFWSVNMPLWIPTILFGSLFSYWYALPLHRRCKRKKLGLCVKCGYDLRGSKDRCPECGLSLEKRKTKGESTCEQEC